MRDDSVLVSPTLLPLLSYRAPNSLRSSHMVRERGTDASQTGFWVFSVLSDRELLGDKLGLGGCIISLYFLSNFLQDPFQRLAQFCFSWFIILSFGFCLNNACEGMLLAKIHHLTKVVLHSIANILKDYTNIKRMHKNPARFFLKELKNFWASWVFPKGI